MTAPAGPAPGTGGIAVRFDRVSIVFGDRPQAALPYMDEGLDRAAVKAASGQVLGVHDCSLSVAEGEILVLMGLSGSGKSTLLRAVNGLNPVCRGAAYVSDGDRLVDVSHADPATLRRIRLTRVAMVFQQFGLLPWRTVRENVGLGLELAGVPRAERDRRVRAQLELVGLADWADRKVGELSGGMQQRVGLARAFATEAPILLMDEPFSALDPLIRTRLQDELLELQARLRRTILFVSHDLDEAFKLGNRIAIMEGGRIVQCGTPREIFSAPATPYVADFVAHMNPLGVLTARDVMEPGAAAGAPVAPETPVRELLARLSREPVLAVGEAGQPPLGRVTPESVLARLHDPRGGTDAVPAAAPAAAQRLGT
jgi:glycine betaine/proline transport system ATP-binding protein